MRLLPLVLVASTILLISGCVKDRSLAGEWTGKVLIENQKSDDLAADIARALSDSMALSLNLKPDGSYEERVMFFGLEGSWAIEGNELVLTPNRFEGKALSEVKDQAIQEELLPAKRFVINREQGTFGRKSPAGDYQEEYTRKTN